MSKRYLFEHFLSLPHQSSIFYSSFLVTPTLPSFYFQPIFYFISIIIFLHIFGFLKTIFVAFMCASEMVSLVISLYSPG